MNSLLRFLRADHGSVAKGASLPLCLVLSRNENSALSILKHWTSNLGQTKSLKFLDKLVINFATNMNESGSSIEIGENQSLAL